jgi:hypothetical protein
MAYQYDRRTAAKGESFDSFWENITYKATKAITDLDVNFVGTPDYMGIAYFWNMAYKFEMRDASLPQRRAVHAAFLKDHLELAGESPEHEAIIKKLVK